MYAVFRTGLILMLFLGSMGEAKESWRLKTDQAGIQIYQQHRHPKYRQWHTKGVMTVEHSAEQVLTLLRDLDVCAEWVYGCQAAERLDEQLIRMIFEGPLWYKDRDVVFSTELLETTAPDSWLVRLSNQPHLHPVKKLQRIQTMEASWYLVQIDEQQLSITYELYIDPDIGFKSGVNKYNRDAMLLTLQNMRIMLQRQQSNNLNPTPKNDQPKP